MMRALETRHALSTHAFAEHQGYHFPPPIERMSNYKAILWKSFIHPTLDTGCKMSPDMSLRNHQFPEQRLDLPKLTSRYFRFVCALEQLIDCLLVLTCYFAVAWCSTFAVTVRSLSAAGRRKSWNVCWGLKTAVMLLRLRRLLQKKLLV